LPCEQVDHGNELGADWHEQIPGAWMKRMFVFEYLTGVGGVDIDCLPRRDADGCTGATLGRHIANELLVDHNREPRHVAV
jgi:hypothetical protein